MAVMGEGGDGRGLEGDGAGAGAAGANGRPRRKRAVSAGQDCARKMMVPAMAAGRSVKAGRAGKAPARKAAALRPRHDGFTPARQRIFLETLRETGCILDACRSAGISSTTAYNARQRLPDLEKKWDLALAMVATPIEMIAYERATVGAERTVIREGKVVQTERKPSDTILRTLMLNGQRGREAAVGAAEREKIRAEVRRELELEQKRDGVATHEELVAALAKRIAAVKRRYERQAQEAKNAEGDGPAAAG